MNPQQQPVNNHTFVETKKRALVEKIFNKFLRQDTQVHSVSGPSGSVMHNLATGLQKRNYFRRGPQNVSLGCGTRGCKQKFSNQEELDLHLNYCSDSIYNTL
ncbi:hypothetical protein PHYBLDRAFT_58188 [Phycomyces blakesleeanus NRRL 1555(-)]|uniref:Uncharacterized protein n=1 Tax=Phycomyces blakesleeanus (strain ATCC 8743b / DSM 1359 / FGSC 10004 / NBRC 33097 / NRRL 1555) TaxID=763407 RepID=A0A167Q661_PHYB8|nr:hypothetical protein PHYBLDRAFT_58188 [Phycomyces blakesleeanus NRRL 1555(-)]OAD79139.1 hypothetical protein PHYBLDRAFT_58188 [Phycomyces blakesleeanus NRRL 1555(-)]|eukprot:XP_018297179.1 hypothetical protein PHYBLDRAFT_58188 [Phycomyces blakesleeanus NRRL 1555(-)]